MPEFFQDKLFGNNCYGCGAWNSKGLQIKSFWDNDEAVCIFDPKPHHAAMPPDVMNGGTISTIIDCHCVCSSIAEAYKSEGREIGEGDPIWYATGYLKIDFKKPTRMDGKVTVRAKVSEKKNKTTLFIAKFFDKNNEITCEGEVLSVRVPRKWTDPKGLFQN
ncbi:MAG: PaaI family thioesterase [Chloroflexota bacterium]|nr:PaaI family thioesterase [Chloroflexota bacterium]